MPLVSIVLPAFNRPHYLQEAVASVFAQSEADWELIIADDGSAIETRTLLQSFTADPRVRILWLEHSGSPATARNAAIAASRGEFVAFLDSDDAWQPDKLRRQIEALRARPECEWAYCAFRRVDAGGVILADDANRHWLPCDGDIFQPTLRCQASIRTPCVIVRRAALLACGGFDAAIAASEDYDLWMRLALRSPVALVNEPLVRVRITATGYSAHWPHVVAYQIMSIEKLQATAPARWQGELQRQRARHCVALAREYAARGEVRAMLRTLFKSCAFAWRYPEAWSGALKALLRT